MKKSITPIQLGFLLFLYLFSGLSVTGADSLISLFIPFSAIALWAGIASLAAGRARGGLVGLLCYFIPKKQTIVPIAFFMALAAGEAVLLLLEAGASLREQMPFLPFLLLLAVFLGVSVLSAMQGVTVLGRVSEMTLFLSVPLVLLHLFGEASPMLFQGRFSVARMFFCAMPAPVFFLLSHTKTAGDADVSAGFRARGDAPRKRGRRVFFFAILGAGAAVALRVLILVLPFAEATLLGEALALAAHFVKMALLLCLIEEGARGGRARRTVSIGASALLGMASLAVFAGEMFFPEMWIFLLVLWGAVISAMLALFGVFLPQNG